MGLVYLQYLHLGHEHGVNVGKHSSTMVHMGLRWIKCVSSPLQNQMYRFFVFFLPQFLTTPRKNLASNSSRQLGLLSVDPGGFEVS
jgi:hypothetical protein